EPLREHDAQHVLGRVSGSSERAGHLADQPPRRQKIRSDAEAHGHDVAVARELRPGHAHRPRHRWVARPDQGLVRSPLDVGADQRLAVPVDHADDSSLRPTAGAEHLDLHPVTVERAAGLVRRNEDVLLGPHVHEAEAIAVDGERPLEHLPAARSLPGPLAVLRSSPACQPEPLPGPLHPALAHQRTHRPLHLGALAAVEPGGPQQLGHAQRVVGLLQGPQEDRAVEPCCHARSPGAQARTATVSRCVFATCAGANTLARKKSTSYWPGFRGVKKNSRVPGPVAAAMKFASRSPMRLATVGSTAQVYPARSGMRTASACPMRTSKGVPSSGSRSSSRTSSASRAMLRASPGRSSMPSTSIVPPQPASLCTTPITWTGWPMFFRKLFGTLPPSRKVTCWRVPPLETTRMKSSPDISSAPRTVPNPRMPAPIPALPIC